MTRSAACSPYRFVPRRRDRGRSVLRRRLLAAISGLLIVVSAPVAQAIRPFITDDARAVGARALQLETWLQVDRTGPQHWVLPAFGPTHWLELTMGAVHGRADSGAGREYSLGGPLLQAKALVMPAIPNGFPGIAVAAGVLTPGGRGALRAPQMAPFIYLAATESLLDNERILIHANLGIARNSQTSGWQPSLTAGLGTQIRVRGGLHSVAEVFWNDAYVGDTGAAWQAGGRFVFNDNIQLDTTMGSGFARESARATWFSGGLRLVSNQLW